MGRLYNKSPNDEGLKYFEEALETKADKKIPTNLIVKLLKLVLTLKIVEFGLFHEENVIFSACNDD